MKTKTDIFKRLKSFDFFGHGVSFLVDGTDKSQSYFGAIVSLLSAMLVGAYFIYQLQIMCRYSNTSVSYILNENVFEDTEIIQTPKDRLGFNFAFGVFDYSSFKAVEGIENIGSFNAEYLSFDKEKADRGAIPIRKCTEEDKKKFYKPNKIYAGNFDLLFTKMYCITSPEKLFLNGDWNGDVGSGIFLSFDECDS